MFGSSLETRH